VCGFNSIKLYKYNFALLPIGDSVVNSIIMYYVVKDILCDIKYI